MQYKRNAYKLDELGTVGRGRSRHRPRNDQSLYGGIYPFFQTGDIKAAEFYLTEHAQTYNEKGLSQSKLWQPGTLCITIAANIAESAILGIEGCFPDSVVGFVADESKADVRFIKYYMDTMKISMQNVSRGTTQDNLSLDKLLQFDFIVPEVDEQRRIAGILSAYDELIANNQRRIAVLEQMARALYREWFVHFRAPGVVMKEGDELPEEWEVKRLGEVADSVRSSVAKGEIHEAVPFLGLEHIPRRSLALDAWEYTTELGSSKLQFQKGDILFGKIRPYFHKVSVAPFSGLCSADTIVIRSKRSEHFALVTCLASSDEFVAHASATANGAKMPRADWKVLKNFHVRVAPPAVLEKFSAFVMPAIEQMQTLVFQNVNLRRTRDLLLPRLMSGRVELDLQLETDGSFQR